MASQLPGVLKEALGLDAVDRAKLIDALHASLESEEIRAVERAWAQEAESRLDAFDEGQLGTVAWDDLKAKLKK